MKKRRHKNGTSKEAAEKKKDLFVHTYVQNGDNGTRAHMEVFGTKNYGTAAVEACKLIKDPKIRAKIDALHAEMLRRSELTTERWYREVSRLSFFDPRKLVDGKGKLIPLHLLDADTAAAISAIETEVTENGSVIARVRPHSKTTALDMAAKVLRVYDAPPPLQDDKGMDVDTGVTARRVLFLLAKQDPKRLEHNGKRG